MNLNKPITGRAWLGGGNKDFPRSMTTMEQMLTIAAELFKLLTNHIKHNECGDDCCVKQLLSNLEWDGSDCPEAEPNPTKPLRQ
jgi:hypothetical protein